MAARILIADDDAVARRLVENMVQKCGYETVVVESGDAAIATLTAADAPPLDAMVLDLVMPGLDGMGVLAKIREAGLNIPVIVQTAHGGIDNVVSAMRAGAQDFVVKPVGVERLQVSLRNALNASALKGELQRIKHSREGKPHEEQDPSPSRPRRAESGELNEDVRDIHGRICDVRQHRQQEQPENAFDRNRYAGSGPRGGKVAQQYDRQERVVEKPPKFPVTKRVGRKLPELAEDTWRFRYVRINRNLSNVVRHRDPDVNLSQMSAYATRAPVAALAAPCERRNGGGRRGHVCSPPTTHVGGRKGRRQGRSEKREDVPELVCPRVGTVPETPPNYRIFSSRCAACQL